MPWQILAATSDEWQLNWQDVLTVEEAAALPEHYPTLGREHGTAFHPDLPVIPYVQESDHTVVPPICQGRWGYDVFVNQEVKSLIERMESAEHFFHPLELHLKSGEVLRGSHFLLRVGGIVDGILPEESQVKPYIKDGKLRFYRATTARPKVTWRAAAISGKHLWVDQYFVSGIFCSDEFMDELKRRKIGHFRAIPSKVI